MHPDEAESEDEGDDVINEMQSRVTNIQEAKRWILSHRPSMDANVPPGVSFVDDNRPVLAMRRPTYAASVFQQARLWRPNCERRLRWETTVRSARIFILVVRRRCILKHLGS